MSENSVIFTPEKSKKIALARLDLLNQWKEFRRKSNNKLQADYDFVNLHNTSNSHLFDILGKISRGTGQTVLLQHLMINMDVKQER